MTVKELIEKLQQLDPDLRVFTCGYEGGFNDVVGDDIQHGDFVLDFHEEWYYGKHEAVENVRKDKDKYTIVKGIIL